MRYALLADIHGNLEALRACLAHAAEQGAGRLVFLGDLVGYGADPEAVVDTVARLVEGGAIAIRGNHDAAACGEHTEEGMNEHARKSLEWTRLRLTEAHVRFLAGLRLTASEGDCFFVHASAVAPEKWIYVSDSVRAEHSLAATDARYTACGHVHEPMLYYTGAGGRPLPFRPQAGQAIPVTAHRKWLAIAGSVGQPRDGNRAASYALLDRAKERVTFCRVPYDWEAAAGKIRMAGLPESLARRLREAR